MALFVGPQPSTIVSSHLLPARDPLYVLFRGMLQLKIMTRWQPACYSTCEVFSDDLYSGLHVQTDTAMAGAIERP